MIAVCQNEGHETQHCDTCQKCFRCYCRCGVCRTCDKRVRQKTFCSHCYTCRSHCQCRRAPKFIPEEMLNILAGGRFVNTLPRLLGIELEIGDWGSLRPDQLIPNINYTTTHDWSVKPSEHE